MEEEDSARKSVALQESVYESSKPVNEEEDEDRDKEMKSDEQRQVSINSGCTVDNASTGERGESRASQSVTLASVPLSKSEPLSKSDLQFDESSHLLSEIPVKDSLQPLQSVKEVKDQVKEVNEEPSNCTSSPTAQLQTLHQMQVPDGSSRLELSSTSVTQSISSISNPTQSERKLQQVINGNNTCFTEEEKKNSPRPKLPSVTMPKTPSDGYNWRKYGQKQVKSPEGSRSYYRCTFSDCSAKKIECSNRSNRVVETVYRSHHNHNPPQILSSNRQNRPAIPITTLSGSTDATGPVRGSTDLVPSTSKEPLPGSGKIRETKQQESNSSDETTEVNAKDVYVDGPECKKRKKRTSTDELGSLSKSGNKPKFVVHAAGDVGISGDGYRWRKYGQKMVKGNPYPRNYYRCTSAGCPVRKQIERAVHSASALIITYKGGHNHDMPVPRKRHGPKTAHPVPGISVSGDNLQIDKNETHLTQLSADNEGKSTGEALNLGGKRTTEPARTLLSVGFEIKPC